MSAGTVTSSGAILNEPAWRPRMLPKMLGASNRGTHIHSTVPLGDSSADTSPSLMKPYSPIGVDRTWETGELTWPGWDLVEDFLAAMTEAFRHRVSAGKQSTTIDDRPTSTPVPSGHRLT